MAIYPSSTYRTRVSDSFETRLYLNFGKLENRHPSFALASQLRFERGPAKQLEVRCGISNKRVVVMQAGLLRFAMLYVAHIWVGVTQLPSGLSRPAAEFHAEALLKQDWPL